MERAPHTVIIGAGFGGLAAALRARAAGWAVTVVEAAAAPGGKARAVPSAAGLVDTGPTVLTLRDRFDALFGLFGERLDDHVRLIPQDRLARHFWPDGSRLDLFTDPDRSAEAIAAFAGPREAEGFRRFHALTAALYAAFDAPVMQAARPDLPAIARAALRRPRIWPALIPGRSLPSILKAHFRDPRLVQLFARYSTYVGGRPARSPAVLALIWQAEAAGVWAVEGGLSHLARALADLAARQGVVFRYGAKATRISRQGGRAAAVTLAGGEVVKADAVVFNGDPAALADGVLGEAATVAVPRRATAPRSLSAQVWAFAATATGPRAADLIHHNLFFAADQGAEFGPLMQGALPREPTLYICAEDRAAGPVTGPERFEIILNAPPLDGRPGPAEAGAHDKEAAECATRTFPKLAAMGLSFSSPPGPAALTTPTTLEALFPGSRGSIYGRSPEGAFAAFARPPARTGLPGLYLAGGGAHPGAGVPMATLSGTFAAEAMIADRISPSPSRRTAMPGGISTGWRTRPQPDKGPAPFR